MTKITGLTALNVRALEETMPDVIERGDLTVTATTATWVCSPAQALSALDEVMARLDRLPTRGQHPRHSLHAVRRKLVRAA